MNSVVTKEGQQKICQDMSKSEETEVTRPTVGKSALG
jgi:hypothetical protein